MFLRKLIWKYEKHFLLNKIKNIINKYAAGFFNQIRKFKLLLNTLEKKIYKIDKINI